jgi:hypothetical protein
VLKISIPLSFLRLPFAQYRTNHNLKKGRSCRRRDEGPRQGPSSRPQFGHGYCDHRFYTHSHQPLHCTPNVHNPRKGYPYRCQSPLLSPSLQVRANFPLRCTDLRQYPLRSCRLCNIYHRHLAFRRRLHKF